MLSPLITLGSSPMSMFVNELEYVNLGEVEEAGRYGGTGPVRKFLPR
jgi:hypothetical protein